MKEKKLVLTQKIKEVHEKSLYPPRGRRHLKKATKHNQEIKKIIKDIPKISEGILSHIKRSDEELARLENEGMINGYLQLKDGDKYQLYTYTQDGSRQRIYIGNKIELIELAKQKISNFEKHKKLSKAIEDIAFYYQQIENRTLQAIRIFEGIVLPEIEE